MVAPRGSPAGDRERVADRDELPRARGGAGRDPWGVDQAMLAGGSSSSAQATESDGTVEEEGRR
jgi:hypothetical protein